jgi:hypothetical protein
MLFNIVNGNLTIQQVSSICMVKIMFPYKMGGGMPAVGVGAIWLVCYVHSDSDLLFLKHL